MQRVYEENEWGKVSKRIVTIPPSILQDPRLDVKWELLRLSLVAYRHSSFLVLQPQLYFIILVGHQTTVP